MKLESLIWKTMWKWSSYITIWIFFNEQLIMGKKDYTGSTVIRVSIEYDEQLRRFRDLSSTFGYEVDKWGDTDLFLPNKDLLNEVTEELKEHGFSYKTLIKDVGRLINDVDEMDKEHEKHLRHRRSLGGIPGPYVVGRYATYEEIVVWLHEVKELAKSIVKMYTLGKTYHQRPIYLLKIGTPLNRTKPAIWIDCGSHAREWISISTGIYVIYHLLEGYITNHNETTYLLDNIDIYVAPIVNPDGYVYSHEEDRMWRKNRSPDYSNTGCRGTDINRNFGYHWGEVRASCYQCDRLYKGPTAFSEPESQAVSLAVQALNSTLKAYITVHSYSQMWLTRWAYSVDKVDDHDAQIVLVHKALQAIYDTNGKNYTGGTSAQALYAFSGGAADWAKGVAGIKYSFGVELRDKGEYGFLLPADQINGTGAEFLAALRVVSRHIIEESTEQYLNQSLAKHEPVNLNNIVDLNLRRNNKRTAKLGDIDKSKGTIQKRATILILVICIFQILNLPYIKTHIP